MEGDGGARKKAWAGFGWTWGRCWGQKAFQEASKKGIIFMSILMPCWGHVGAKLAPKNGAQNQIRQQVNG